MKFAAPLFSVALLLSACQLSLAGDLTPPPGAALPLSGTAAPIEFPPAQPNPPAGALLYAANCAACHGASGLGDGGAAQQLAAPPTALGNAGVATNAVPTDWYAMITNGNLEANMPPFAGILSLQERWDLAAYALSLSANDNELQTGALLFAKHEAVYKSLANDFELVSSLSRAQLADQIAQTNSDLSPTERAALALYIQAAAFGFAGQAGSSVPTAGDLVTITGQVQDGTDGDLPSGLEANLFVYDHDEQVYTAADSLNQNGSYSFQDVPTAAGYSYFVSVDYLGLSYFSEFATVEDGDSDRIDLPIVIFDTTTDTSQLASELVQLFFDFSQPGSVRVIQRVVITNIGNQAVAPTAEGEPVLTFSLPPEATDLQFESGALGDRYIGTQGGFGDLRAVAPGEPYENFFAYELPYSNRLRIPAPIDLPTRAVLLLLPAGDIEVLGEKFQFTGTEDIDGLQYSAYVAEGGFMPGGGLTVELSGPHPNGSGLLQSLAGDDRLLLALAALTLAVGIAWIWLSRSANGKPLTPNQLMDEIIALDESYEQGAVSQRTYEKRREALKDQLRSVVEK
jgi:mono/diheme cytochrome c family protein